MYKVYKVEPPNVLPRYVPCCRQQRAEEANTIIAGFKNSDTNNWNNSWGYCEVDESNAIESVLSERKGIVLCGIYYYR